MTALQKVVLGTPPKAEDGDTVRVANIKANANVDVLSSQAALTSVTPITAAQALTQEHIGRRVSINLAAAGVVNLPPASSAAGDSVTLLRNIGSTVVTLKPADGSGDTLALSSLNPGESALLDSDGVHAWSVLMRGRSSSADETVNRNLTVGSNVTVAGDLTVGGNVAANSFTGKWQQSTYNVVTTVAKSSTALNIIPSSGGDNGGVYAYGSSDSANSPYVGMYCTGAFNIIHCSKTGNGAVLPLDLFMNGVFTARFYTGGGVGFGNQWLTPVVGGAVHVATPSYQLVMSNTGAAANRYWLMGPNSANNICIFNQGAIGMYIVDGGTSWGSQSDARLKNVRSSLTGVLDAVMQMSTVRYSWKIDDDHAAALGESDESKVHIGVIAQEVQQYFPEIVDVIDPERGYLGVQEARLATVALAAIKELKVELDAVKDRIGLLEAR